MWHCRVLYQAKLTSLLCQLAVSPKHAQACQRNKYELIGNSLQQLSDSPLYDVERRH